MKNKIILVLIAMLSMTLAAQQYSSKLPANIFSFINQTYPNCRIAEWEWEDDKNVYEVEIVHNGIEKDLYFNTQGQWQSTKFDIRKKQLPAKVREIISSSTYTFYLIEDIEQIETPDKTIYKVEMEKILSDYEVTLFFDENGEI